MTITQKFIKRDINGNRLDTKIHRRTLPLNYFVESLFASEFIFGPNEALKGYDVEQCFGELLYPDMNDEFPENEYWHHPESQLYHNFEDELARHELEEHLYNEGVLDCVCGGVPGGSDNDGIQCVCGSGYETD